MSWLTQSVKERPLTQTDRTDKETRERDWQWQRIKHHHPRDTLTPCSLSCWRIWSTFRSCSPSYLPPEPEMRNDFWLFIFKKSILYHVFFFFFFFFLSMIMFVVLVSFVTNFSCFIITVARKLFLWFNFDYFNSSRCSVELRKSSWSTEKIHLKRNYLTLSVMSCNVQSVMCPSPTGTNDTVSDVT